MTVSAYLYCVLVYGWRCNPVLGFIAWQQYELQHSKLILLPNQHEQHDGHHVWRRSSPSFQQEEIRCQIGSSLFKGMKTNEPDQSCFLCLSRGISDEVHQNYLEGSNGKDCYELMMQGCHNLHCRISHKSETIIFQALLDFAMRQLAKLGLSPSCCVCSLFARIPESKKGPVKSSQTRHRQALSSLS